MNLIDATIISIDSEPYIKYGKYFLDVTVEAYGRTSEHQMMWDIDEEKTVEIGDTIQV